MQEEDWKNHKNVEIKQHTTEQPVGKQKKSKEKKHTLVTVENRNITYYGMQQKVVLRGKFLVMLADLRKQENLKLTFHLKELKKEEQMTPNVSRKKEIAKIRVEINEIMTKMKIHQLDQ